MIWFLVNIVAPALLPMLGIIPFKLLPISGVTPGSTRFIALVKDAQLCWAAIGMGISSLYETLQQLQKPQSVIALPYLFLIIFVMLPSVILAAGGAVFSTSLWLPSGMTAPPTGFKKFMALCAHYRVFLGSCVLCAVTAYAYTVLHFGL